MRALVLDVHTPNYDGPDGSYTRLLIAPITAKLREHINELKTLLQVAPQAAEIKTVTNQEQYVYLIRPSLAKDDANLSDRLDAITQAVHATGITILGDLNLTTEELDRLRDETSGIKSTTITPRYPGAPTLHWTGHFEGDTTPALNWETAPIDTDTITKGAHSMSDQPNLEREQATIQRGLGVMRDVTTVSAYGHEVDLTRGHTLVRINAPSFFQDEGFLRWLNSDKDGPATWHRRGDEVEEYSDVFIHYGGADWKDGTFNAEGSDYPNLENRPSIPNHIYALIAEAVAEITGDMENEALVWISNLD